MGLSAIVGHLASGILLDRFERYKVGGYISLLPGLSVIAILLGAGSIWTAWLGAILLGLATGAEMQMASNLASRYFPLKNFGTLFGLIMGAIGLAAGLGPLLAGGIYDMLGSYRVALWCVPPISLWSAALLFTLGPDRSRGAVQAAVEAAAAA